MKNVHYIDLEVSELKALDNCSQKRLHRNQPVGTDSSEKEKYAQFLPKFLFLFFNSVTTSAGKMFCIWCLFFSIHKNQFCNSQK